MCRTRPIRGLDTIPRCEVVVKVEEHAMDTLRCTWDPSRAPWKSHGYSGSKRRLPYTWRPKGLNVWLGLVTPLIIPISEGGLIMRVGNSWRWCKFLYAVKLMPLNVLGNDVYSGIIHYEILFVTILWKYWYCFSWHYSLISMCLRFFFFF